MEHTNQKIYGFWDGDFTFHISEYEDPNKNILFRVRIDNKSPEERARQNETNFNQTDSGWTGTRKADLARIEWWLRTLPNFPLRSKEETEVLRRLCIEGTVQSSKLHDDGLRGTAESLLLSRLCVRDFQPKQLTFVQQGRVGFSLTPDGKWLTSLMR